MYIYILFAERIIERVANVCSLDPWKNTNPSHVPVIREYWKRLPVKRRRSVRKRRSNRVAGYDSWRAFYVEGGRSWSVFFPFSLWRERGGGRRPMVQRTRVASRRRSRDARHPRSFPRLCVPPFPRHLRIWKRDRRSNHAVQAQEVLDFSRGE